MEEIINICVEVGWWWVVIIPLFGLIVTGFLCMGAMANEAIEDQRKL